MKIKSLLMVSLLSASLISVGCSRNNKDEIETTQIETEKTSSDNINKLKEIYEDTTGAYLVLSVKANTVEYRDSSNIESVSSCLERFSTAQDELRIIEKDMSEEVKKIVIFI